MGRWIAALVFTVALAVSASAETLKLFDAYNVSGTNPDGSSYSGSLILDVVSDTTYTVRWNIAGSNYRGFGMRMNNALSATYTIGGEPGLVMYEVRPNGVLEGIWAIRGRNGAGTETLTPK